MIWEWISDRDHKGHAIFRLISIDIFYGEGAIIAPGRPAYPEHLPQKSRLPITGRQWIRHEGHPAPLNLARRLRVSSKMIDITSSLCHN